MVDGTAEWALHGWVRGPNGSQTTTAQLEVLRRRLCVKVDLVCVRRLLFANLQQFPSLCHNILWLWCASKISLDQAFGEGGRSHEVLRLERSGHRHTQEEELMHWLQLQASEVGGELNVLADRSCVQPFPCHFKPHGINVLPANLDDLCDLLLFPGVTRHAQRCGLQRAAEDVQAHIELALLGEDLVGFSHLVLDVGDGIENDWRHVSLLEAALGKQRPIQRRRLRHRGRCAACRPESLLEDFLQWVWIDQANPFLEHIQCLFELSGSNQVTRQLPLLQPLGLGCVGHANAGLVIHRGFLHCWQIYSIQAQVHVVTPSSLTTDAAQVQVIIAEHATHVTSILVSVIRIHEGELVRLRHLNVLKLLLVEDLNHGLQQRPVGRVSRRCSVERHWWQHQC
mmetsp:Transcript_39917/g.93994  ORF Transcript_39917/g.93994 Transcript_39917/m.93994 type:complete len:397 (+) Transcript_39917:230-1420(+)